MYARKFNQDDTHQCKSTSDAHILGWRLETEQTDHIGHADIAALRSSDMGIYPFPSLPPGDHKRSCIKPPTTVSKYNLFLADILYFQVAHKNDRAEQQHCHDDPRDHDRLRHRDPAKTGIVNAVSQFSSSISCFDRLLRITTSLSLFVFLFYEVSH